MNYSVDCFEISLHKNAYLVHVKVLGDRSSHQHSIQELPDWIFSSRHAIWLIDENQPMYERAMKGEKIKKHLMALREAGFSLLQESTVAR